MWYLAAVAGPHLFPVRFGAAVYGHLVGMGITKNSEVMNYAWGVLGDIFRESFVHFVNSTYIVLARTLLNSRGRELIYI